MKDVTATMKTLNPKRILRRPNAKTPKKAIPSRTVTAVNRLEEPEGHPKSSDWSLGVNLMMNLKT
jgi:hypothetical protein